jgi:hypothetical protein
MEVLIVGIIKQKHEINGYILVLSAFLFFLPYLDSFPSNGNMFLEHWKLVL